MVLLKTEFRHLQGVREHAKHATDGLLLELMEKGTALIQVTSNTNSRAAPVVKYVMTYLRCYPDSMGDCKRIWGKQWQYIIESRDIYAVKEFDIRRVQVTNTNYGRGAIRFVYVREQDAEAIRAGGYLEKLPPFTSR